jgi:predicted porin
VQDSSAELQAPIFGCSFFLKEKVMKKSLIALAIASAVSAPAFAATSNVDIYGVLNMSVNFVNPDVTGSDKSNPSVTSTASRLGFKGSEDLGGGLSAIWQIESGFNADEQSGTLASRNSFLGLSGGWGTVLFGNHDTPMKMTGRLVDNFQDTLGDARNILGAVSAGVNAFDLRTKNTMAYVTPDFSGFNAVVAYVTDWAAAGNGTGLPTGANALDNNNYDAWSVNGTYKNGPLMLGAAYENHNTATPHGGNDMWRLVGSFDIAGFKLGGEYEKLSGDVDVNDRDAYGLFGNYTMGAWVLKANYLKANDNDFISNSGADQWTLGADYNLSKRTVVYGYYASVSNDAHAAYGLGQGAGASDQTVGNYGSSPNVFGIGMRHAF